MRSLLLVVLCACVRAAQPPLPLYEDGALSSTERARLFRELPAKIDGACARVRAQAEALHALWSVDDDCMQAVRVRKRLELAQRLGAVARREWRLGDVTGLAMAERALWDLEVFAAYFRDEECLWKRYPRRGCSDVRTFDLVRDFGAVGDGKTPVDEAWQRAMDAIRARGGAPSVLYVPAGDYLFTQKQVVPSFTCVFSGESCRDANVRHAQVPVFALENCIISGADPETVRFRFGAFASQGLRLVNCRNVTVRNVQLAYVRCPFLQGVITAVDPARATCDVRLEPGTLAPDDPAFTEKGASNGFLCASAFTPTGDLIRPASFMFYARKYETLGTGRYRLGFDDSQPYYQHGKLKVGDVLVVPARNNFYHAASMAYCDFCNFENVWVRNARAAAFSVHRGHASTFDRCRLFPEPGRMLSANADGLICSSGTCLMRSVFRNQSDDGFNAMSRGVFVNGTVAEDGLLHDRMGRNVPGEMMLVVDPATGRYRGNLFARAAGDFTPWRDGGSWRTFFTRPCPTSVRSYDSLKLSLISSARQGRAAMNLERLKAEPDHLYAPGADGLGTVVSGCTIRNMRGTGVVIQSAHALVENNVFSNIWHAIHLGGLVKYKEGPPPYNAVVRENVASDVEIGFETGYQVQNGGMAQTAPIRRCLFTSNRVEKATSAGYAFYNLGYATLRDNQAVQCRRVRRMGVTECLEERE